MGGRKAEFSAGYTTGPRPPEEVLAVRDAEYTMLAEIEPTPNMTVLGDPPPWRSALHERKDNHR
jgi:hypothetical protein